MEAWPSGVAKVAIYPYVKGVAATWQCDGNTAPSINEKPQMNNKKAQALSSKLCCTLYIIYRQEGRFAPCHTL